MTNTEVRQVHAFVMVREKDVLDHLADHDPRLLSPKRHASLGSSTALCGLSYRLSATNRRRRRTGTYFYWQREAMPAFGNRAPLLAVGKCPTRSSCAKPCPATGTSDVLRGHELAACPFRGMSCDRTRHFSLNGPGCADMVRMSWS